MNTSKLLIGGIAGGVVSFLLGWIINGILLKDVMAGNMEPGAAALFLDPPKYGTLIISNLAWGFLIAIIFSWSGTHTALSGLRNGAIIGLVTTISIDLYFYSMMPIMNMTGVCLDIAAWTVLSAGIGAVVGMLMGRKSAPTAA